jgi:ribulose-phosphate 3-epimerase
VNPGFGGQKFIPNSLKKVRELARKRRDARLSFAIEIDGGITLENVGEVVRAGCDRIVTGSSIFHAPDSKQAFQELQRAAQEANLVKV